MTDGSELLNGTMRDVTFATGHHIDAKLDMALDANAAVLTSFKTS